MAHSRDDDDNGNKCCYRLVVLFEVKGAGSWKENFSVSCHFLVIVFFFAKGCFENYSQCDILFMLVSCCISFKISVWGPSYYSMFSYLISYELDSYVCYC